MTSDPHQLLADWLTKSQSTVVLTGAGISTESGIPDFRSPGGVWTKYRTVYFDEFMSSASARHEYWTQKSESHRDFFDSQPNIGHQVLAKWEQSKRIRGVITQNIDGLHEVSGNQSVLELHGTARYIQCLDCSARYDADPLVQEFLKTNEVPYCHACSAGRLKHATISFGQMLPEDVLTQAFDWCREAELILAIGSSLVVTPAANLPLITKQSGGKLVIINRDATPLDVDADLVINAGIGETLSGIEAMLERRAS